MAEANAAEESSVNLEIKSQEPDTKEQKTTDGENGIKTDKATTEPNDKEDATGDSAGTQSDEAKTEPEVNGAEGPSPLESKIIRQVEYYFGDVNLPRDKFLQQEIKEDDGWVPLDTMLKFNRLNQLSSEKDVIAAAMKKSTTGLIEVNDDKSKIRRCPDKALPEFNQQRRDDLRNRSIYAKGFPEKVTLEQMEEFFEKCGKTENIYMRKSKEREFKGSCFVIYETVESAKKFIECDDASKYGDTDLIRMLKEDYFKMKGNERKHVKEEEIKEKNEKQEQYRQKQEEDKKKNLSERITHGAVLSIKNVPEEISREDLKAIFETDGYGTVAWVEFDRGDKEAKLRFQGEDGAKEALKKVHEAKEGKVMLKDTELECIVLEGDEELDYWKFVFQTQQATRDSRNKAKRGRGGWGGGRGGGRGGGHWGKRRSGGGGRDDGEPSAKVAKND